ncbi:ArsR/SmtB family transcription factor [Labrys monachus]|uniref:DNA-binding transcriptional ArsR family regulator n=1 Tax=Labrys monachus TaxID=217067 RepID=A0ABU0FND1_9HYPH|nr:helix-turn-helix domain-containing protein [Labrys monachus]MDQ0396124.1 DNA-binding transcriptional ArsR family regulator [Labrys monachus]
MARVFLHPAAGDITLDGVLHALADPARRAIVRKLMVEGGMNCSRCCADMPPSTVSHHHRILRESGLIRSEKRGVEVVNVVRREEIEGRFPGLLAAILNQSGA